MSSDQCKEPPHRIHVIIRVMQNVCKVCHDCALPVHVAEGHEEKKECVKRIPVPSVRPSLYMYMYMRAHCNETTDNGRDERTSEETRARSVHRKERGGGGEGRRLDRDNERWVFQVRSM